MKFLHKIIINITTVISTVIFSACGLKSPKNNTNNVDQYQKISLVETNDKPGYKINDNNDYYQRESKRINSKIDQILDEVGLKDIKISVFSPSLANLINDLGLKINALPSSWQYSKSINESLEIFEKNYQCDASENIFYYSKREIVELYKALGKEVPKDASGWCYQINNLTDINKSNIVPQKIDGGFKKPTQDKIFNLGHIGEIDIEAFKFAKVNVIFVEKNYIDLIKLQEKLNQIDPKSKKPIIIPISTNRLEDLIVIASTIGLRLGNLAKTKEILFNLHSSLNKIILHKDKLEKVHPTMLTFLYVEGNKSFYMSKDTLLASLISQILSKSKADKIFKDTFKEVTIAKIIQQKPEIVFNLHSKYTKNSLSERKWRKIANKEDIVVRYWKQNNNVSIKTYEFFNNLIDELIEVGGKYEN